MNLKISFNNQILIININDEQKYLFFEWIKQMNNLRHNHFINHLKKYIK